MFSLPRIQNENVETQRFFDQLVQVIEKLDTIPILDGVFLEDIALAASGDTIVDHKLGRRYRGWIICGKSSDGDIYEDVTGNNNPERQIILTNSSGALNVNLWVF